MKKLILAGIMALSAVSSWAVDWEVLDKAVSGDRVMMGDQEYILLTVADYEALYKKFGVLTSLAKRQWKYQHETHERRAQWHGQRVSTTVTTNEVGKLVSIEEYKDGYRHVTEMRQKEVREDVKKKLEERENWMPKIPNIPRRKREAKNGVNFVKEVN